MSDAAKKRAGVLGRGPIFWLVLTLISFGMLFSVILSGAIENRSTQLILTAVPIALFFVMVRASFNIANSSDPSCYAQGDAQKVYIKRTAIFTSLYLASFAALTFADEAFAPPVALRTVLAILPGLAISGMFWAIGRLIIEETDEFIRMLTIRQTLIASALALSAASIWGFLETADLVPHLDAYWIAVVWFVGLFVGAVANRIEHGTWGAV